jgi:hypothetical protein
MKSFYYKSGRCFLQETLVKLVARDNFVLLLTHLTIVQNRGLLILVC